MILSSALAVDGAGNLYAGGSFTMAGGVNANRIAKWDGAAWSPLGNGMTVLVCHGALAVDGAGNLYAGGRFDSGRRGRASTTSPNGTARPGRPWAAA